jgi:hypothetical protein
MADYKNIKGFNIQYLDSDPPNPIEGQMWFNSTTQTLKGAEVGGFPLGTWASGGDLNTARFQAGGAGTQTAGLAFGGALTGFVATNVTEEYNGSTWTTLPATLNTARRSRGVGATSSAALFIAGTADIGSPIDLANVESYNGSAWTEITDVNTARRNQGTAGIQTAALLFGGTSSPSALTELWNGTSWTEVNDLNTGRDNLGGFGSSTSAVGMGGVTTVRVANTESWNGTSWTEVNDLNTARDTPTGIGTSSSTGLSAGGRTDPGTYLGITESWDGTSWTEVADLATARADGAGQGIGSSTSGLLAGGAVAPGAVATTEEWTVPEYVVKTFTTS